MIAPVGALGGWPLEKPVMKGRVSKPLFQTFIFIATLLSMVAVGCRRAPEPAPTPTSEPEEAGPWAQILERGSLNIGTSADYPPFAFYTPDFELTGYDIALSREIGRKLGLEVVLNDMAFDGLGGALQVGQIDAAIAAISVTDARREQADFSNVYFVSEDAVLGRAGEAIVIDELSDLSPYRVAVQNGSVFESWLQEDAVTAGIIPPDNLFVYAETDRAIADLETGLIDVVVADSAPLDIMAQSDAFSIVGRGLNRQRFAIAVPTGSDLLPHLNQALIELQNEGVLAELADRYLDLRLADLAPLPTPEPTPSTPEPTTVPIQPPVACVDAMAFVQDLNLSDQNMTAPPPVSPGTPFQKGWRVRNSGTCTWDSSYILTPTGGNVPQAGMGGRATPVQSTVAPGATYDFYVDLVAPLEPGVYQGFWSMRGPRGLLFGDRLWVGITVPAPSTPTPAPTTTPSTSISFTVDRTNIRAGECVVFQWQTRNASQVFFYAQGQPWQQNQVGVSGRRQECPPVTTTFDLRTVFTNNDVDIRSIRIDVDSALDAPVINSFTVTPGFQIVFGQCVDVRWQISGEVSHIRVTRNTQTLWDGAPLGGTSRDCPPVGDAVYTIEATGPGGTSRAQQTVNVQPQPTVPPQATTTLTPPPTQPPSPPVIFSFGVNPTEIIVGECVAITWSVGGSVNRVQIKRDAVVVLDFANLSGNVNDCLSSQGVFTYRVEATSADGQLAFQQAVVTAGSPSPGITGGWRLVQINGAAIIPGTEITAIFGDSANLSGSAGCNTYTTGYQVSGNSLSVGLINTTQSICAEPLGVMDQESLYITVLGSATGFEIQGRQLSIRSARGQLVYENLTVPR
jgi:arginine/lysine/histidine transporter system substrate-binding protein